MSYNVIAAMGTALVTVPAAESIVVSSMEETVVVRLVGYPNVPEQRTAVGTVKNGTTVFGPYSAGATIEIQAGPMGASYAVGVSPVIGDNGNWQPQAAPVNVTDGGSMIMTAAALLGGIVTATPSEARNVQLPTGANVDLATEIAIGESFDWSIITLAGFALTVTANTGHTIVGAAATGSASGSAARFRTRKTAADTFVTYRIGG